MADLYFNLRALGSTLINITCSQALLGFAISYYIVADHYVTFESDPFANLSNVDNRKYVTFYLGACSACLPAALFSTWVGVRWLVLISSLSLAALLPVLSVLESPPTLPTASKVPLPANGTTLGLLFCAGGLFGLLQTAIYQGACVVELIAVRSLMGRLMAFSQGCVLLGLLAGSLLSSGVGHPGSFPSLSTFLLSLLVVALASCVTFGNMYSRVQEGGVRERVGAWLSARGSRVTSSSPPSSSSSFSYAYSAQTRTREAAPPLLPWQTWEGPSLDPLTDR